ncbi:hypothetical protein MKK88_05835 [Methylobacterium sp. E-005]|uniref:portal protein n=1 Tax=Methylobacterium sp. E-005 TaxID=2836549 RepID=UPI001FB88225|nr:hypothetical protein [Methylobacterium sp. E-005]MCJ2085515.1 hypothetical protein [Methylobacterium sp. E-005]
MAAPNAYGMEAGAIAPVAPLPATDAEPGVPLTKLKKWFSAYQDAKEKEMLEARDARLYYHASQWTQEELHKLELRRQPPVVINRFSLKIDGIVGVVVRLRQDPKASPRTQAYAEGAEIGTAAVREVLDSNRWEALQQEVSHDLALEGIGGTERDVEMDSDGQPNTIVRRVAPNTWWYDPRSMSPDFSDCQFFGVYKWVDLDVAIDMLPEKEAELRDSLDNFGGTDTVAQQDAEKNWFDSRLERVKLIECWYKQRGAWRFAIFTGSQILKEGPSPWLDDRGKTRSRYNMGSAGIDQDGDRYGFYRNMKWQQDEINHRRSKLLWMMSVNQAFVERGGVDDPDKLRDDLARPDSVIEYNPNGQGVKPFEIRDQSQQMQGQQALLAEAKAEIDNFGPNPSLLGQTAASASGRAVALQQQAGIAQLGPYFGRFKQWKLSLYRDIWRDVQQLWTLERSIRVSDPNGAQFIDVNKLVMTPTGPRIANAIGELDLDIVMDEGPDVVTQREDVMGTLREMIQQQLFTPPQAQAAFLELSDLPPSVKSVIKNAGQQQPDPQAQQLQQTVAQIQLQGAAAKVDETRARTEKLHADAQAAGARAQSASILDQQHAVNTAATITDIAHKQAKTNQIGAETAREHMHALGQAPVVPGLGQPMPMPQRAPLVPRVPLQGPPSL